MKGSVMTIARQKYSIYLVAILAGIFLSTATLDSRQKKKITPEIAYKTPPLQLTKQLPNITGWEDDKSYIDSRKKEGEKIAKDIIIDAKGGSELGEKKTAVRWEDFKNIVDTSIDAAKPLVSNSSNTRHIYKKDNDLYLLDVPKKE